MPLDTFLIPMYSTALFPWFYCNVVALWKGTSWPVLSQTGEEVYFWRSTCKADSTTLTWHV